MSRVCDVSKKVGNFLLSKNCEEIRAVPLFQDVEVWTALEQAAWHVPYSQYLKIYAIEPLPELLESQDRHARK